ncbi:hypothetical protein ACHAWF_001998, partial [Thalassiosira exigua]
AIAACFLAVSFFYQFSPPLIAYITQEDAPSWLNNSRAASRSNSNWHGSFPTKCGRVPSDVPKALSNSIDLSYDDPPAKFKHAINFNPLNHCPNRTALLGIQVCLYDDLVQWNKLSRELGIANWAVHGGSAMGARSHGALNPRDDDVDLTIYNCTALDRLWATSESDVAKHHPDLDARSYSMNNSAALWEPRLVKPGLLLLRGSYCCPWYKLLTVNGASLWRHPDHIMRIDMECASRMLSGREIGPKRDSKWMKYMKEGKPMMTIPYGPTTIQTKSPCKFPYTNGAQPEYFPTNAATNIADAADDGNAFRNERLKIGMEFALKHWYVPSSQRKAWMRLAGNKKQTEHTAQLAHLDTVEVDNSISPGCSWGTNAALKVAGWNAECGTYWYKFYNMIQELEELHDPYVILMNEMDIGMTRSGNVHTARRLALELGMNYAYGVEFLELTRETREEQSATEGLRDVLSLHDNAILSKCIIGDTMILRDALLHTYFSNQPQRYINANGYEVRLGGRMGLFARIFQFTHSSIPLTYNVTAKEFDYSYLEEVPSHFTVGNIHKVDESDHNRRKLWNYYAFGRPPTDGGKYDGDGISQMSNQLGVVIQGDISLKFCSLGGLELKNRGEKTFRVNCLPNGKVKIAPIAGDYFCSNMHLHGDLRVTP